MTATKTLMVPKGEEIRAEAIETIIERLGIAKAAFFIREIMSQKVDYLKIKDELFGKKTADEVYKEIKKEAKL